MSGRPRGEVQDEPQLSGTAIVRKGGDAAGRRFADDESGEIEKL